MKKIFSISLHRIILLVLVLGLVFSCSKEIIEQEENESVLKEKTADPDLIEGHYIVVVSNQPAGKNSKAASVLEELTNEMHKKPGANVNRIYKNVLTGFAARLTDKQVQELRIDSRVEYIEQDAYVYPIGDLVVQEYATWGLDRIDQQNNTLDRGYAYTATGKGVTAYVVDSGIRYSHHEFGGRATLGYDFVLQENPDNTDPGQGAGEDCNGHGTHVAGTVGGNKYGVAKNVNLISVRVFGCSGGSPRSRVIAAIDWVTKDVLENKRLPALVNMSLGGSYDPDGLSYDIAISNSTKAGVNYIVAAGNSNDNACNFEPARNPLVLTVGASQLGDEKSSFSNYGECVDIYAPGTSISSAWHLTDNEIVTISGTSMAAPHVAGVVALYLESNPESTPSQVHTAITSNATQNAVSNVPSGVNNLLYSLWEQIQFPAPPQPDLMLKASGEKIRSYYVANLTWKTTEAKYITVIEDGVVHFTEHYNDGEQQIRLRDKGRDATYTIKICEVGYDNCSEEVILVFGNGSEEPVNSSPSAGFNYTTSLLVVQFSDTSTDPDGSITAWNWDFGDGNFSTVKNPEHIYVNSGSYTVSLIVTDDAGATGRTSQNVSVSAEEPQPGEIVLNAIGSKVKGAWQTDLTWTPSGTSEKIDIYRNGNAVATVSNNGRYTDATSFKGGGSLNYKVCEAGTTNCSNEVTVQF